MSEGSKPFAPVLPACPERKCEERGGQVSHILVEEITTPLLNGFSQRYFKEDY